jgi:NADH:ubiquinone oxidoreductase subunit F (NADH-binding)/NADH:ubiquinone oxidoreductase subunit E
MTIIEELRRLQERDGYLSDQALRQLAERLSQAHSSNGAVPLYRLQELVSFFPHFRRRKPAPLEVDVCRDMACHLRSAAELRDRLDARFGSQASIHGVSCLGRCDRAPAVCVRQAVGPQETASPHDETLYLGRSPDALLRIVADLAEGKPAPAADRDQDLTEFDPPRSSWQIDVYAHQPELQPYAAVRKFLTEAQRHGPEQAARDMIQQLRDANLLGMGGAGVPAAGKWDDVYKQTDAVKFIVCNGDESEPGTFKDRELLLRKADLVLEGVILAGLVVNARQGYIFIRHEYGESIEAVRKAIARARAAGVLGAGTQGTARPIEVDVFVSPGGYICGEQGALLEAMEDRRAQPRDRPPEPASNGLFDKPTLLSNVETFAWAPAIYLLGGIWYRDQSPRPFGGRRLFSISGDVKQPGVYEMAVGDSLGDLLTRAGGTADGLPAKAVASSGPSGGFLPCRWSTEHTKALADSVRRKLAGLEPSAERDTFQWLLDHALSSPEPFDLLRMPLDLNLFRSLGMMLGAGLVVYGHDRELASQAVNCLEFFRNESCGKCVPCRLGSQKLVEIGTSLVRGELDATAWQEKRAEVEALQTVLEQTSICGLGAVAANPLTKLMKYFPGEIQARLRRPTQTSLPSP